MNMYEATKIFLKQFCPNVLHSMFNFREENARYEGVTPSVIYYFENDSGIVTHSGQTQSRNVRLGINLLGDLEEILPMKNGISAALNGKSVMLSGFDFALVQKNSQDVFVANVVFRLIYMQFEGVVIG